MVTYGSGEDWEFSVEENRIVHDSLGDHAGDSVIQLGYNLGDIDSSLATYYPLEEGQGEIARDGALNNFAQFSGTSWTTDSAIDSNALDFASGDYVETPFDTADIISNEDLSVALWIKPDSVSSSQSIINNYGGGASLNHFIIELGGGNGAEDEPGVFLDDGSTGNWHQSTGSVTAGAWNHIGFSYEQTSNTLDLYVDGVQTNSVTYAGGGIDFGQRSIAIGIRRNDFSTLPYAGLMDDIRIYDRALSQYEFQSLANQTVSYTREVTESDVPSNADNGVARFEFDGDVTDTWGGNDGTDNTSAGFITGVYNQAKAFDGADDYIRVPNSAMPATDEITFAWWQKGGSTQPSQDSSFEANDASGNRVANAHVPWDNETVYWDFGDDPNDRVQIDLTGTNWQEWKHWTFVSDANAPYMAIYLNGDLLIKDTGVGKSLSSSPDQFSIGSYAEGNDSFYDGNIDDFRIYDRALSVSEIESLFNLGKYKLNVDNTLQ